MAAWGRLAAVVCAIAAVLPSGCSWRDAPPGTPPGFTEYRGDGYTFAHPRQWTVARTVDERGVPLIGVNGEQGVNGTVRGQVIVSRRDGFQGSMKDMLVQARALSLVGGRRILSEKPTRVHGAREARAVEAVYGEQAPDGAQVEIRSVDVYALTGKGTMLDFTVRAIRADFDAVGLPKVLATFRVAE